jgi:hypothetical protein
VDGLHFRINGDRREQALAEIRDRAAKAIKTRSATLDSDVEIREAFYTLGHVLGGAAPRPGLQLTRTDIAVAVLTHVAADIATNAKARELRELLTPTVIEHVAQEARAAESTSPYDGAEQGLAIARALITATHLPWEPQPTPDQPHKSLRTAWHELDDWQHRRPPQHRLSALQAAEWLLRNTERQALSKDAKVQLCESSVTFDDIAKAVKATRKAEKADAKIDHIIQSKKAGTKKNQPHKTDGDKPTNQSGNKPPRGGGKRGKPKTETTDDDAEATDANAARVYAKVDLGWIWGGFGVDSSLYIKTYKFLQ